MLMLYKIFGHPFAPPKAEVEGSNPFGSARLSARFRAILRGRVAPEATRIDGTRRELAGAAGTQLTHGLRLVHGGRP